MALAFLWEEGSFVTEETWIRQGLSEEPSLATFVNYNFHTMYYSDYLTEATSISQMERGEGSITVLDH